MRLTNRELLASLQDVLLARGVPGASATVFHGGEIASAAAGVTNAELGIPVTIDTVMHIGSIAKVLNATLIMQLVDDGTIDLDKKVVVYLPELRLNDRDALEQITVRMLLNHTSGIDGNMLPDHGHDEETIEKGIARFATLGHLHPPGAEYSYCNAATVIAGYVAQRVTRRSWYELVREQIFRPLEMRHSATLPEEALLFRAGVGHYRPARESMDVKRVSRIFLPLSFSPGGTTLMVSAPDLIAFTRAHLNDGVGPNGRRILSRESARMMREMSVDNSGKGYTFTDGIGIGWMVWRNGLLHHSGGGPGIFSVLYAHPGQQFIAAILTNGEFGLSCKPISQLIETLLRGIGIQDPCGVTYTRESTTAKTLERERFIGAYQNITDRFRVVWDEEGLALSSQGRHAIYDYTSVEPSVPERLLPVGGDMFVLQPRRVDAFTLPEVFRIFTFRSPDRNGRMQYLANGDRLYMRVSDTRLS